MPRQLGADMVGWMALAAGPGAGLPLLKPLLDALPGGPAATRGGPGLIAALQQPAGWANQGPVASADGRWLLCFTGRLDNYRELWAELAAAHRTPSGHSFPEVVLAAFREWGENAVLRLRGDFAFALADLSCGSVYLARDLLGTKPLYWSR
ncbi:MAG: asparagine synthetase B, partial [Actinomycetota bacterium]